MRRERRSVRGVERVGPYTLLRIDQGGLEAVATRNERQAARLYAEIDRTGFYRGTAEKEDRSLMNVTFRLSSEGLEQTFVKESTAAGRCGVLLGNPGSVHRFY